MKRIGLIAKPHAPGLSELLHRLLPWLAQRHVDVLLDADTAAAIGETASYPRTTIPDLVDFMMVLGGDGTLLSVARLLEERDVPILGINLGSLGFLTEITTTELFPRLKVLDGHYVMQERMRLKTCIHRRDGACLPQPVVLNDVVINKGALARIIDLETSVDDLYLTTYRADGLIVSTPGIHSLFHGGWRPDYASQLAGAHSHSHLSLYLESPPAGPPRYGAHSGQTPDERRGCQVTLDGQIGVELHYGDVVDMQQAAQPMKLIRTLKEDEYFHILRTKLKWGEAVRLPQDTGC